jgi:hypothetical protein
MSRHPHIGRIFVLLGMLLAPFVAVQIQQRIFRHRAERLLADLRALQLRQASLAEMQAEFTRWVPHGNPCSEDGCSLEGDSWRPSFILTASPNPMDAATDWHKVWLPALFRSFGGHVAHLSAWFGTPFGRRMVSFEVDVEASPGDGSSDYHAANVLSGSAMCGMWFSLHDDWQGLTLHPNYVIGGMDPDASYPPLATSVYVAFGPHAAPADVERLMSFDLSCLTRWRPCREPRDLMPEAAAQFAQEEPQLARARKEHVCGPDIVGLMARDALYAGVVEVTGKNQEVWMSEGPVSVPTVRMLENFKPNNLWKTGEERGLEIYDVNADRVVTHLPPEVHPGNRLIILAQPEKAHPVRAERCGIVPLNLANWEFVQRAIPGSPTPAKP